MKNQAHSSLIDRFTIKGVHGYKDISIEFAGPATVIVAENGTGKTTILNALNAFLSRRFHRLASISFDSIECEFSDELLPVTLGRDQLGGATTPRGDDNPVESLARVSGVSGAELLDYIQSAYVPGRYGASSAHPIAKQMYLASPYSHEELAERHDSLHRMLDSSLSDAAKAVSAIVRERVGDREIVYLPTYRRIERPLIRTKRQPDSRRTFARGPARARHDGYDDMAFGLTDVEERLIELSEEIERRSSFGYRSLSAKILDEMLRGRAQRETLNLQASELPDIESLSRFLSRVGRDVGPVGNVHNNINSLYTTGQIHHDENWLLRYFLSRLGEVINETREMELKVEQFVDVCNSYLTLSGDIKKLSFDPKTLKVLVQDLWANCLISLDDLSSGEKQIVSLMSRLYLSDREKIVLIDEPELSLSLDWQRKVLPDVVNSGTVVQMLAITHSPFVFENALDNCVRSLEMRKAKVQR